MIHDPQKFVVTDPRTFDGTSYEVAGRSVAQLRGLVKLLQLSLEPAELMARSASLERDIYFDKEPDAVGWPDSPQGRRFGWIREAVNDIEGVLNTLERAASYDPKHPPTE